MRKGNIREWRKDEVEEGRRVLMMMMIRANADDGLINDCESPKILRGRKINAKCPYLPYVLSK